MGRVLCDTTFLWKALGAFIVKNFFLRISAVLDRFLCIVFHKICGSGKVNEVECKVVKCNYTASRLKVDLSVQLTEAWKVVGLSDFQMLYC